MMTEVDRPQGITRTDDQSHPYTPTEHGYSPYKLGLRTYTFEVDTADLPLSRDFEATWREDGTRFTIEREDNRDYYRVIAEPAGNARRVSIRSEYGPSGSSTGGGNSVDAVLSAPWDYTTFSGNRDDAENTTASVTFTIDYAATAISPSTETSDELLDRPNVGNVGGVLSIDTPGYKITPRMLTEQARILIQDAASKPIAEAREHGVGGVLKHYWESSKTVNTAKNLVSETMWKLGLRDEKPQHVKDRELEKQMAERWEEEKQRQQPDRIPPGSRTVSEKNNRCPDCNGRFHKDDLDTETVDANQMRGTEYVCPDCGSVVASDLDYTGPIPVETPQGTELH